jgi:hypothetical protein
VWNKYVEVTSANRYGEYTDIPVDKDWWCRFDVLSLPEQHRKILNRQPVIKHILLSNGIHIVVFLLDIKVISN